MFKKSNSFFFVLANLNQIDVYIFGAAVRLKNINQKNKNASKKKQLIPNTISLNLYLQSLQITIRPNQLFQTSLITRIILKNVQI